jgi:DNA-nicking Smr family endonuclease
VSRKRAAPPAPRKGERPLAGLAGLRRQLVAPPGRASKAAAVQPEAAASEPAEDAAALFRAAVDDARPLPAPNRAELERAKPAPIRRPQAPEPVAEDALRPRRPATESELLREAMADVAPLRDSGRAEVPGPPGKRRPVPPQPPAGLPSFPAAFPAELPTGVDPHDPAALFHYAVQGASPLDPGGRLHLERPTPAPLPLKRAEDDRSVLQETLHAPLSFEDRLDMGDEAAFLRAGLPRRVLTDLRRGRWVVQGELDLHGLTREEARATLARFLAASLQQGLRCLRVIHGKGLRSPGGVGLLKQLSRGWLAQREEILAFCQARPHDGGSGALLVLLRASRGAPPPPDNSTTEQSDSPPRPR